MSTRIRLNVDISSDLNTRLEDMARGAHTTKSELLRKAIALFDVALSENKQNHRLGILDSNGRVLREIVGI